MSKPAPINTDVVLIGGGIMSATLGTLLQQLQPNWKLTVFERLTDVALESSGPWNNAGTGHSALAELNYTPERTNGSIDISAAVRVNEQYQTTRQFWSHLVKLGAIPNPSAFVVPTAHMSFVWGEDNVRFLRKRFDALKDHPLFAGLEFSDDASVIGQWAPLLIPGRNKSQPIAATHVSTGTDVDFGALTHILFDSLTANGAALNLRAEVTRLHQLPDGRWLVTVRNADGLNPQQYIANFVFVGAGGRALNLLQKAHLPEARGYAGFPVSGKFLRSDNQTIVARHQAKIYGRAELGSPPMSVPHLDVRVVDGRASLMFGPYAGFSPKFLKSGSVFDLAASVRWHNLIPMIAAGLSNLPLVGYLLGQLAASKDTQFKELRKFVPYAEPADWQSITAGQRVQVIKKDRRRGGVLQFGTEVITAADGSIAGLLGASPGASTAVPIMLELLETCFPDRMADWRPAMVEMIPTLGISLAAEPKLAETTMAATARALRLQ